jgi:molybdopterin synthase catalytic subunit
VSLLTSKSIDPGGLLTAFCSGRREVGAVASFTGLVRADEGAAQVLELEAYPGFTDKQIAVFAEQVTARYSLVDCLVVHRIGRIKAGDPVVFVACAAGHRRAAFEACEFLVDHLKSRAPFWKKQHGPQGARWIEPTSLDLADAARWDQYLEEAGDACLA